MMAIIQITNNKAEGGDEMGGRKWGVEDMREKRAGSIVKSMPADEALGCISSLWLFHRFSDK